MFFIWVIATVTNDLPRFQNRLSSWKVKTFIYLFWNVSWNRRFFIVGSQLKVSRDTFTSAPSVYGKKLKIRNRLKPSKHFRKLLLCASLPIKIGWFPNFLHSNESNSSLAPSIPSLEDAWWEFPVHFDENEWCKSDFANQERKWHRFSHSHA